MVSVEFEDLCRRDDEVFVKRTREDSLSLLLLLSDELLGLIEGIHVVLLSIAQVHPSLEP